MADQAPTAGQLDELIISIREQNTSVVELRSDMKDQSETLKKAERLTRRAYVLGGLGVTIGVIGIIVAVFAVGQSWRTNDALGASEEQRQERTIASCQQSNDFYAKHNHLVGDSQQTWIQARDQSTNVLVKDFAQKQIDAFEQDKIALRDCSPDGIAKYLTTSTTTP